MTDNIKNILEDLYIIDDKLRQYEKQLIPIVKELLAAKPQLVADKEWQENLRGQLWERLQNKQSGYSVGYRFGWQKMFYGLGGLALLILLVVPWYGSNQSVILEEWTAQPQFTALNAKAFGSFVSNVDLSADGRGSAAESDNNSVAPAGYGGGGGDMAQPMMVEGKMIMPREINKYNFVYEGEALDLSAPMVKVLRRVKGDQVAQQLAGWLASVKFENLDLSSFKQTKVQQLTLVEDRPFGYSMNLDFINGNVYIGQYWEQWQEASVCQDDACWQARRLHEEDVPADDVLIGLANSWLAQRNIDMSAYGQPSVENEWRRFYLLTDNKADYYIPEVISVIYPLQLEGKTVYDQGGNVYGLRVPINIINNKVAGVSGLSTQQYESSDYPAITDSEAVLQLAARGGMQHYYYPDNATTVDVKLGTPYVGYVQYWNYQNNISEEFYVPALIFPITEIPDDINFYQKKVVVPLAQDMFDRFASYPKDEPPVRIMEMGSADDIEALSPADLPVAEETIIE
ncbi:MAG: hypothetical protein ACKKL5_00740 [Candidatus Komeilibacteria bacterium]